MLKVNIKVTLELSGPILSQSITIGDFGIDAPMAKSSNGFYLPGTLIKGKLRESWKELGILAGDTFSINIDELLGKKSDDESDGSFDPHRGSLYFSDFIHTPNKNTEPIKENNCLHRIAIEKELGSVQDGSYLVMDAPFMPGGRFGFVGTITFFATTEEKAIEIQGQLETGFKWITTLGAERTIGFGRLEEVRFSDINKLTLKASGQQRQLHENNFLYIKITPLAPFCLSKRRVSKNLFESEELISGGVLKGAIADNWNKILGKKNNKIDKNTDPTRQELGEHFDKLRIAHAFPALPDLPRPVKQPLSLIKDINNNLYDTALIEKPALINKKAPAFAIDWKNENFTIRKDSSVNNLSKFFGWPKLNKELRVRTAIDEKTGRAADKQLFAYETILPEKHEWYSKIDFSAIPGNDEFKNKIAYQLQTLLSQEIYGFGKTKIPVKIEFIDTFSFKHISRFEPILNKWIITLQTPAILCNPNRLRDNSLQSVYQEAFSSMSSILPLKYFYAQQSLAGGRYLQKRFHQDKPEYRPYLLTDPGSVFVFESCKENVEQEKKNIEDWFLHGLPLPGWAKDLYDNNWSKCPYIKENGYGEIAVNLDIHSNFMPKEGEYEAI